MLSFRGLSTFDKQLLKEFLAECYIVDIELKIKELTISIRTQTKTKLPDAIIAATAIYYDLPLLTMDKGFQSIEGLQAVILSI